MDRQISLYGCSAGNVGKVSVWGLVGKVRSCDCRHSSCVVAFRSHWMHLSSCRVFRCETKTECAILKQAAPLNVHPLPQKIVHPPSRQILLLSLKTDPQVHMHCGANILIYASFLKSVSDSNPFLEPLYSIFFVNSTSFSSFYIPICMHSQIILVKRRLPLPEPEGNIASRNWLCVHKVGQILSVNDLKAIPVK